MEINKFPILYIEANQWDVKKIEVLGPKSAP